MDHIGLHTCFDGIDREHERVFDRACNGTSNHVLAVGEVCSGGAGGTEFIDTVCQYGRCTVVIRCCCCCFLIVIFGVAFKVFVVSFLGVVGDRGRVSRRSLPFGRLSRSQIS